MYHNSTQYQNFLTSGSSKKKGGAGGLGSVGPGGMMSMVSGAGSGLGGSGAVGAGGMAEAHSTGAIEPAEDDAIDDSLGVRQLSGQRFTRNQRLLMDIFNEYVVPDQRSVVTQARLEQLRKQVHSLESHQEKLELELKAIDEKYEAKKRRFLDSTSEFNVELDKVLLSF